MELRSPSKKIYKLPPFDSPLPICDNNVCLSDYDWPLFTGKYNGTSVIIDETSEIIALSKKGFFGKGSLSKGGPKVCKKKSAIRVVNENQWKRRKEWSGKLKSLLNVTLPKSIDDQPKPENGLDQKEKDDTSKDDCHMDVDDCQKSKEVTRDISDSTNVDVSIDKENIKKTTDDQIITQNDSCIDNNSKESNMDCANSIDMKKENNCKSKEILEPTTGTENLESLKTENTLTIKSNSEKNLDESAESNTSDNMSVTIEEKSIKNITLYSLTNNKDCKLLEDDELVVIRDLGNDLEDPVSDLNLHIEKEDIKTVIEVLYLSLEEAFFLSFALNCLQVIDLTSKYLSNKEMWNLYQQAQPDFVEKYVAYHHFRSKGWVVKSGLKYGGDFLLYKKGPLYFHASYIVLVKVLNPDGSKAVGNNALTWEKMLTLNRMAQTATKEVLICEVMQPDSPKEMFQNPSIIKEYKVGELLLRRWQPTQEKGHDISL